MKFILNLNFVDDILSSNENFNGNIKIDLSKYNGDEIFIDIHANSEGYVTFVDNWSPGWRVFVNDDEKKIIKALKAYKAVKVGVGKSKIKFKYYPW